MTFDEPEIGREISSTTVQPKYAQKLKDYDFENTLTETACALWFGLGGDFRITTRAQKWTFLKFMGTSLREKVSTTHMLG